MTSMDKDLCVTLKRDKPINNGDQGSGRKMVLQSVLGGITAAVGLEMFLHPHDLIAGGITGISALVSFHTNDPFAVLLIVFNLPILLLYWLSGQWPALIKGVPGLLAFAGAAFLLGPVPPASSEPVIAAMAGGLCLGIGAGMAAKAGGLLDSLGLELRDRGIGLPMRLISPRYFTTGRLLLCHGCVLVIAGLLMDWERTLYSALACMAAYEASAFVLYGTERIVLASVANPKKFDEMVQRRLRLNSGLPVQRNFVEEESPVYLKYKLHVWDIPRFKAVTKQADPNAEVIILDQVRSQARRSGD
ncbi:YitT family protein [Paenibacillus chibensis]|uniref:YitT family protein n=1 Tax=Paenibacillus chibensis TaxID=59846 RepID=UPI000FDB4827|nr:YitT family protein [Paenibacillus chibensis]MEC0370312.1 YitT family protein [Paenibacillus chibensis]